MVFDPFCGLLSNRGGGANLGHLFGRGQEDHFQGGFGNSKNKLEGDPQGRYRRPDDSFQILPKLGQSGTTTHRGFRRFHFQQDSGG